MQQNSINLCVYSAEPLLQGGMFYAVNKNVSQFKSFTERKTIYSPEQENKKVITVNTM